jgi:hypothetical protein
MGAKSVVRPLATAAIWVRIQTSLINHKCATYGKEWLKHSNPPKKTKKTKKFAEQRSIVSVLHACSEHIPCFQVTVKASSNLLLHRIRFEVVSSHCNYSVTYTYCMGSYNIEKISSAMFFLAFSSINQVNIIDFLREIVSHCIIYAPFFKQKQKDNFLPGTWNDYYWCTVDGPTIECVNF